MGEAVQLSGAERADPAAVRRRLRRSITALERMVSDGLFDTEAESCGFEVELDLVDPLGRPRQVNDPLLATMDREDVQAELSQFNIELNLVPRPFRGRVLSGLEDELGATFRSASALAQRFGARVVAIGTLPTLHAGDLTPAHLSANPRYPLLDAAMAAARHRSIHLAIEGQETLRTDTDSIAVQAAATSFQVHIRVAPADFARYYNAAQLAMAAQVAAGGNSPYLLGRRLWHETRIALLEQALDLRVSARRAGEPPRAWAGDRWARSGTDVLADNVRRFPPLLPLLDEADPLDELAAGRVPQLHELRLHNGTIWRWNRPVYDVQHGHPHLRIENRVLPSGPTPADMTANAAFFLGLVRSLADEPGPALAGVPFGVVHRDLHAAARDGLAAQLGWGAGAGRERDARHVLLRHLLPRAADGLDAWGVDAADQGRYLGIIEGRVARRATGADWQTASVAALERSGHPRDAALRETVRRYVEHAGTGAPVHTWPA